MDSKESKQDESKRPMDQSWGHSDDDSCPSMTTLIIWNVNKALERKPSLDLKVELKEAEATLGQGIEISSLLAQPAHKRHISCALLAWQQLGHANSDSLFSFLKSQERERNETLKKNEVCLGLCGRKVDVICKNKMPCLHSHDALRLKLKSGSQSPVIPQPLKLPNDSSCFTSKSFERRGSGIQNYRVHVPLKIKAACCSEKGCNEKLQALEDNCNLLKMRLTKLSERETNRVKLLEKAETAWVNLEIGYTQRLRAVVEKEEDIERQIKTLVEERNNYKNVCANLVQLLKPRGEAVGKLEGSLKEAENKLRAKALEKLKLIEKAANEDALLSELTCQHTQQDRDLQFKEQQAIRRRTLLQGELDAVRGLTYEQERAMRAELSGLHDQIKQLSKRLLKEDDALALLNKEVEEIKQEKRELAEDLSGCQEKCDEKFQKKMDQLLDKKKKLQELQAKVLDCKCKVPIEKEVEVKRTPSLAVLCLCEPEFRGREGCSCTSLRTQLLADLLRDLFMGLQQEISDLSLQMPCQLLKCLDDKYSWGKGSNITDNLTKFFSKILVNELDIAIATSIENYHAKWVGTTCADVVKIPDPYPDGPDDATVATWVQHMAVNMAHKMFQAKADEVMKKANEIISSGPNTGACRPFENDVAAYHVQVESDCMGERAPVRSSTNDEDKFMKPNRDPGSTKLRNVIKPWRMTEKAKPKPEKSIPLRQKVKLPVSPANKPRKPSAVSISTADKSLNEFWKRTQQEFNQIKCLIEEANLSKKQTFHAKQQKPLNNNEKFTKFVNRGAETDDQTSQQNSTHNVIQVEKDLTATNKIEKNKATFNYVSCAERMFAVNYVGFCGMQINKANGLNGSAKLTNSISHITPHCTVTSSTEKQFMAINSTGDSLSRLKDKNTSASSCESINKLPTPYSVDKLLQTLEQWKCHLNQSFSGNEAEKPYGSVNREPMRDIFAKLYDDSKLLYLSDVVNLGTTKELQTDPSSDKNRPEKHLCLTESTSEYMTTVNSGNDLCQSVGGSGKCKINRSDCEGQSEKLLNGNKSQKRCQTHHNMFSDNMLRKAISQDNIIPFQKYNVQHVSYSKILHVPIELNKKFHAKDGSKKGSTKILSQKSHGKSADGVKFDSLISDPKEDEAEPQNILSSKIMHTPEQHCKETYICKNIACADSTHSLVYPPCDCGYQIKFLGVTLANSCSEKSKGQKDSVVYSPHTKTSDISNKIEKNEKCFWMKSNNNNISKSNVKLHKSCSGNKLEEVKAPYLRNAQVENLNNTYDNQSDNKKPSNTKNCVVCADPSVDANNLKDESFSLLEEQLKRILSRLKVDCNNMVKPHEKQKIISQICNLENAVSKIAQFKCKCVDKGREEGSWQKAYTLLREYLKIKMNRAQCSCFHNNTDNMHSVLPDLTEKVCHLIENDFRRLLNIQVV